MLTQSALVDLYRDLREEPVLSVYLDARSTDFSQRNLWRKHLDHQVAEARQSLNGSEDADHGGFERALGFIHGALASFDQYLPDQGWVGFATADRLVDSHSTRVPMPDLVRWETGIRVAPYVRALKQERVVVAALVDSRRARLFEYRDGHLEEPFSLLAETLSGDLSDVNVSKRATSHSGVRGRTATDAAQRVVEVSSERMLKQVMDQVEALVGKEGLLILGGTTEAVSAAHSHLPPTIRARTAERPGLRVEMPDAEIRAEVEKGASSVNQSLQEGLMNEVVDLARSGGRGALGAEAVEAALREGRVDCLLLSRAFIRANQDYADHLVGAAFQQHAEVEELTSEGGERLDRVGEGVAARLRYTL